MIELARKKGRDGAREIGRLFLHFLHFSLSFHFFVSLYFSTSLISHIVSSAVYCFV